MNKLFKGFLYGFVFFFIGYVAFLNRASLDRYFSDVAKLPVITQLTQDFKTGLEIAGRDFNLRLKNGLNNSNINDALLNNNNKWSWRRPEIEEKLRDHFGSRQAENRQQFLNYIETYARQALVEMKTSGIPASVTLAQGILETKAGDSYIARVANNHFGIKCYKYKNYKADGYIDDHDFYYHKLAQGCVQIKDDHAWDRFQVYPDVATSYRHHTLLLSQESRYNWMIGAYADKIGENCQVESHWFGTDNVPYYVAWCIGLKKSGYATSKRYAQKLAYIIETYELWRFDYQLVMS